MHIVTDDSLAFEFDVLREIKRISSYKRLYGVEFFKQIHFRNKRIYWDYDHDFHIDQVLAYANR